MNITGQIANKLRLLRLTGMLETMPVRLKQASDHGVNHALWVSDPKARIRVAPNLSRNMDAVLCAVYIALSH